jgi:hypothetical protein
MTGESRTFDHLTIVSHTTDIDSNDANQIKEISKLHSQIGENLKTVIEKTKDILEKVIRIGELLTQKKETLDHGEFGPWIKENLPFKHRTANRYMEIYRNRHAIKPTEVKNVTNAYKFIKRLKAHENPRLKDEPHERMKIIITPDSSDSYIIFEALNKAKVILETESISRVIALMASDWIENNIDTKSLPPLEEKIKAIETIYNVEITAKRIDQSL